MNHEITVAAYWCNDDSADLWLQCSCGTKLLEVNSRDPEEPVPLVRLNELRDKHLAEQRMRLMAGIPPHAEIHKARPGRNNAYCAVCRQRVQRVPGGQGPVWVHKDTGAVVAHGTDQGEDRR